MIQPSQREKLLIIASAALLFILVTALVWRPLLGSWSATSERYAAKKQQLSDCKSTLMQQPEYEKAFEELAKAMNTPGGPAPVPEVLQKVEQLARNAGVTIRTRTPQQPRDKGGFTEVAVECSMDASIDALVKFLFDIRTAQDLLDVTELKVSPTAGNRPGLRADVRIVSLRASGK